MSREDVKLEALSLDVGESTRIGCPFCLNHEKSMQIVRFDTGIY